MTIKHLLFPSPSHREVDPFMGCYFGTWNSIYWAYVAMYLVNMFPESNILLKILQLLHTPDNVEHLLLSNRF